MARGGVARSRATTPRRSGGVRAAGCPDPLPGEWAAECRAEPPAAEEAAGAGQQEWTAGGWTARAVPQEQGRWNEGRPRAARSGNRSEEPVLTARRTTRSWSTRSWSTRRRTTTESARTLVGRAFEPRPASARPAPSGAARAVPRTGPRAPHPEGSRAARADRAAPSVPRGTSSSGLPERSRWKPRGPDSPRTPARRPKGVRPPGVSTRRGEFVDLGLRAPDPQHERARVSGPAPGVPGGRPARVGGCGLCPCLCRPRPRTRSR
ncbi:hypothetical protein LV78_007097 [Actinosynnema pretiosum]|nr:hypothetical protein [Actinosynnema pretiosum]